MNVDVGALEQQLGQAVRARRIAAQLTQAEVAARANVSVGAVSNLERGAGAHVATLLGVVSVIDRIDWIDELLPQTEFNPFDVPIEPARGTAPGDGADRRRVRRRRSADRQ